jgi:methyl-accepting chemotaxis protein
MENLKLKKYFRTRAMITIAIILFSLIFVGLVSFLSYSYFLKTNREDLKMHLSTMVSMAALQVDAEKHSLLKTRADEDTATYKELKTKLQAIRDSATDIHYIYTMRENENRDITFVVDAEEDPTNVSHLGDVYDDASPYLKEYFLTINKTVVEQEFTTDKWGTWYSGYAPFYDKNGKREGVLGIDIKASDIIAKERNIFTLYLIIFLVSGLLASLVGLRLNRIISKSVLSLSNMLQDDKNLEVFPSSHDEIGELKNMFEDVLDKTNESKISIQEQLIAKTKELEEINKHLSGDDIKISQLKKEINDLRELFFKK